MSHDRTETGDLIEVLSFTKGHGFILVDAKRSIKTNHTLVSSCGPNTWLLQFRSPLHRLRGAREREDTRENFFLFAAQISYLARVFARGRALHATLA